MALCTMVWKDLSNHFICIYSFQIVDSLFPLIILVAFLARHVSLLSFPIRLWIDSNRHNTSLHTRICPVPSWWNTKSKTATPHSAESLQNWKHFTYRPFHAVSQCRVEETEHTTRKENQHESAYHNICKALCSFVRNTTAAPADQIFPDNEYLWC